jgi:hypothetical protein
MDGCRILKHNLKKQSHFGGRQKDVKQAITRGYGDFGE